MTPPRKAGRLSLQPLRIVLCIAMGCSLALPSREPAAADPAPQAAWAAVERMAEFFAMAAVVNGGYVYAYTPDLSVRRGEGGRVDDDVIWNQPPGTVAVGAAFLRLYEMTGDDRWWEAAGAAARAIVAGQLASGGWYSFTRTAAGERARWCYRVDGTVGGACKRLQGNKARDRSTLDDNTTQGALGFLLWYDELSGGDDVAVRKALDYGLEKLIAAQYPNGAWPVFLDRVYPHGRFAAAWRAVVPATWSRQYVKPGEDPPYLVLNDHLVRDVIRLLLAAERRYGKDKYLKAAMRSGDFLLASQLPGAQRGWAQTYNSDLEPVWGRPFEPPAVASRETSGAIKALLELFLRTGKRRYLAGAVEARDWLRNSRLPSGAWARFYELETNRPLYVRRDGTLSYDGADLREGYGFYGDFGIEPVLDLVDRIEAGELPDPVHPWEWVFAPVPHPAPGNGLIDLVASATDSAGRLVEDGWVRSQTFVNAVRTLAGVGGAGGPTMPVDLRRQDERGVRPRRRHGTAG